MTATAEDSIAAITEASGPVAWVLHENGVLISVPIKHLLAESNSTRYFVKFKLGAGGEMNDLVFLGAPHVQSIFVSPSAAELTPKLSFVVSGITPSLSLFSLGGKPQPKSMGKLSTFVREKVRETVGTALTTFFGAPADRVMVEDEDQLPLSAVMEFDDKKRRILRLSVDPTSKMIAAADSLGRVVLFDRKTFTAFRVWKGVREARLAWTEGKGTAAGAKNCMCLAIYAPQLGKHH